MDSRRKAKHDPEVHLGQLKRFSLRELQFATNGFSDENILGRGGSGKVYKGRLADGSLVAVKRLKEKRTPAGELQFQTEVEMISMAVHRNLLRLRGFCMTSTERLFVYPHMENGSVASCLRERPPNKPPLDWPTRIQIALGSARGLSYLHDHCDPKIIHRDVKAANILLDDEFEAVVADFGSVKLMDYKDTHINTGVVHGTIGHIAPEYLSDGKLSEKTDVYGYGIMLLELITGQRAFDLACLANDDDVMMLDWVKGLLKEKKHEMLVDPGLQNNYVEPQVEQLIQVALLCTEGSPMDRPKMSEVVRMLEGDGLAEKWYEWQKGDVLCQEVELAPHPNSDWIVASTENLHIVELSGPRSRLSLSTPSSPLLRSLLLSSPLENRVHRANSELAVGAQHYSKFDASTPMDSPRQAKHDLEVNLGQLKRFSLKELQVATDGFSNKNILDRGGFGKVYKGRLADGTLVAVKRLKEKRTPARELQFQTEMEMISMAVHRHLLRLRGFCTTPTERLLVYPYMENGSVASCLRERPSNKPPLDWPTRRRIALDSAKGLSYLHDHCDPKIIHCGVKAANILLDEEFEAVVADFGSAKLMDYKDTHVTTCVLHGTIGHIAPEYLSDGKLSEKTDVYGYGIMLLELITGHRAFDLARLANDDDVMMLDWVEGLLKEKKHEILVDPDLRNNYVGPQVEQLIQLALLCTQGSPVDRPKMSEVVGMLEGGFAEKWHEWQKVELVHFPHPKYSDWIPAWNINDSSENLPDVELSGPR